VGYFENQPKIKKRTQHSGAADSKTTMNANITPATFRDTGNSRKLVVVLCWFSLKWKEGILR
jgi:hypothetical protein